MALDDLLRIRCTRALKVSLTAVAAKQRRDRSNLIVAVLEDYCERERERLIERFGRETWEKALADAVRKVDLDRKEARRKFPAPPETPDSLAVKKAQLAMLKSKKH